MELYNLPTRIAMAQETFKQEVCASSDTNGIKVLQYRTNRTGEKKALAILQKKKEYSSIAFREEVANHPEKFLYKLDRINYFTEIESRRQEK